MLRFRAVEVRCLARPDRVRCRPPPSLRSALARGFVGSALRSEPSVQVRQKEEELGDQKAYNTVRKNNRARRILPSLRDPKSFKRASKQVPAPQVGASGTIDGARDGGGEEQLEKNGDPGPTTAALRRNSVGVQLLSSSLHTQLFPGHRLPAPPKAVVDTSRRHLVDHGLSPEGAAVLPEIAFELPPLRGRNIRDHFHRIGRAMAEPYLTMAEDFVDLVLPDMPYGWVTDRPGWVRYDANGSRKAVDDLGDESLVVFDVETLYKLSSYPVMATAATPTAWYSWLSPTIFEEPPDEPDMDEMLDPTRPPRYHPHQLIPLFPRGSNKPRIVIGHNVGYDRARVAEEYSLDRTSTRWIDTLSLHVATRGITSVQRPAWLAHRKAKRQKDDENEELLEVLSDAASENGDLAFMESLRDTQQNGNIDDMAAADQRKWEEVTSVNSLKEVAALHCGYAVDKSTRDRFGDADIHHASQIRSELQALLGYCASDVKITHDVYQKVFPLFQESCPHPATFAGVLSMGNSFLPVDDSWQRYIEAAEETYRELARGVKASLRYLAEKLRREGKREGDPWHEQMDWTEKKARWADEVESVSASVKEVIQKLDERPIEESDPEPKSAMEREPRWYKRLRNDPAIVDNKKFRETTLPLLLQMTFDGYPLFYSTEHCWTYRVPRQEFALLRPKVQEREVAIGPQDSEMQSMTGDYAFISIAARKGAKSRHPYTATAAKSIATHHSDLYERLMDPNQGDLLQSEVMMLVEEAKARGPTDVFAGQLDWGEKGVTGPGAKTGSSATAGTWPKWYWDLTGPPSRLAPGEMDLTIRQRITPLLLRLQWQDYPLYYSKEYRWLYRVPRSASGSTTRGDPVSLDPKHDPKLADDHDHLFYRVPHPAGEGKNVGSPLSRGFVKLVESGLLSSAAGHEGDATAAEAAKQATQLNVLSSYWVSSRDRIMSQLVVYDSPSRGMILPQVITMGTVTRRAVEATWLTASNAKKNRIGSELKAMVRAPDGYAIVGADVDSEELWISSVMGDSQFGMHGATAIGWMTLEGTKSAGTDLHSKTAGILGTSRDAAKVFNYSRIYGAGQKHAVQLLMQGDASLTKQVAQEKAKALYEATKGAKSQRSQDRPPAAVPSLWHGGSESFLFNTLEAIALSERPTTPALGCGVTKALSRHYLEERTAYLPSRINWVVQSSGVDYLHLLIVSMEYLLRAYDIKARYLISVHDEVRYLAKEEDRYRCALALQIANAWTRALFCYNLDIDDVPQGVTFFSAVDVDHVLRKEVFMSCETPSHPQPIPAGESLDILQLLDKTGSTLGPQRHQIDVAETDEDAGPPVSLFPDIRSPQHQRFLDAQAAAGGWRAKAWLDRLPPMMDQWGYPLQSTQAFKSSRNKKAPASKRGKASFVAAEEVGEGSGGWNEDEWAEVDIALSVSPLFAGRRVEVDGDGKVASRAGA